MFVCVVSLSVCVCVQLTVLAVFNNCCLVKSLGKKRKVGREGENGHTIPPLKREERERERGIEEERARERKGGGERERKGGGGNVCKINTRYT